MNLTTFRAANVRRCDAVWQHVDNSPLFFAVAVAGETGELCNLIKKIERGDRIDLKDVEREIADVLTYLDLLANRLGIDLGKALVSKFNEVSQRSQWHYNMLPDGTLVRCLWAEPGTIDLDADLHH